MRVITTSGTRSFNIVLRDYKTTDNGTYTVYVYNKNTQAESEISITGQTNSVIQANMNQLSVTITDTYNEGDEVSFYITGTGETNVLHRNKIFFTDQTPQNYNIDG